MIERYNSPVISQIWDEKSKFEFFLVVETALIETLEKTLPVKGMAKHLKENIIINTERIKELEKTTQHDVIAFCTSITEQLPEKWAKFFHFGVTSSDIIDTALSLQIKKSLEYILIEFKEVLNELLLLSHKHSETLCLGRSHGIYAEPMIFGAKFLNFYAEFKRRYEEIDQLSNQLTGQLSGAVGNYTILSPEIEEETLSRLGLQTEKISSQVIPRDHIAKIISTHSLLASALERLCVELRHLQYSDINELAEGFSQGQKGSSTMPHKKNPITGENLTGIARVLKSHFPIAQDNIVLWHERDISHSSAERMYLPDNFGLMHYALKKLRNLLQNLVIDTQTISQKIEFNPQTLSSYLLHQIIMKNNYSRERAYEIVQKACFESKTIDDLKQKLANENISFEIPREKLITEYKKVLARFI